jgi:hypothetical protein
MPRKQRFKPSRKPKPTPQTEEAMNGATPQSAQVHNDNVDPRTMSGPRESVRDDDSLVEPDPDQQSR